jgi:hypothetical protein
MVYQTGLMSAFVMLSAYFASCGNLRARYGLMYLVVGASELFSVCQKVVAYTKRVKSQISRSYKIALFISWIGKVIGKVGFSVACYMLPEGSLRIKILIAVMVIYYFAGLVIQIKIGLWVIYWSK